MSDDGKNWEKTEIEDVDCIGESALAIRVTTDSQRFHWIPKSLIDDDSDVYKRGTQGTLIIPRWLAEERGLV